MSDKVTLSDYDKENYDYKSYWSKRSYEDNAERLALNRLFQDLKGNRIIDIGGSFGRLTDVYANNFQEVVILDYSLKTLQKYAPEILQKHPNVKLVAANAYKMPFRPNSFDAGMIMRVLHHIERPKDLYREIKRVFMNEGTLVHEFANKIHIKAVIRHLLKGNFRHFDRSPYQQPDQGNYEGTQKKTVFLNFHPEDIKSKLEAKNFNIIDRQGLSYLRSPKLRNTVSNETLIKAEKFLQKAFKNSNIPPSIIYKAQLEKKSENNNYKEDFKDILSCTKCYSKLETSPISAICKACNTEFHKKDEVWDFR